MRWRICIALGILLVASACGPDEESRMPGPESSASSKQRGCIKSFDPEADLYANKIETRWAEGFTVEYHGHYKLLEVHGVAGPSRFALVRCGAPHPDLDMPVIEVPVRSVATTSTTELPNLQALGLLEHWVAHADLRFVSSEGLRARVDRGEVAEIGGADGLGLDLERLLELSPELLLIDNIERTGGDRLRLLDQVGTHVVPIPAYRESTPLGRTEWILAMALFFDLEAEASRIFGEIESNYLELRDQVAREVAGNDGARPTVLTGGPWQGVWHVPGGESFMARLLADAGGDYPWSEEPGVGPLLLDIERVFERANDAGSWFFPSHWRSLREIEAVDQRLAKFQAFKQRRIYAPDLRLTESGGNDFWERGVFRPDLVLADLVAILHPDLLPEHEAVFHRRLELDPP